MVKLSLNDLFNSLNAQPNSRCIREGECILDAKHIIACGTEEDKTAKRNTTTEVKLLALCLKTSALRENPHEVRATLSLLDSKLKPKELSCTCKAGQSQKCKHLAALLILCTRYVDPQKNIIMFYYLYSWLIKICFF